MGAMIARRYVKALASMMDKEGLANTEILFRALADAYQEKAFSDLINNPQIDAGAKEKMLLEIVKSSKSDVIANLIKLLVSKRRLSIIPDMAEELRLQVAADAKQYQGKVYSSDKVDASTLKALGANLGKKLDTNIALEYVASDYDGVKVEVEDLGVEITLSKSRMNAQLVEHILKAI